MSQPFSSDAALRADFEKPREKDKISTNANGTADSGNLEKALSVEQDKSEPKYGPVIRSTTTAEDWDGPDDPGNPMNWPMWDRIYHTVIPGLFGFTVTFGTSVYSPGYPDVAKEFGVSPTVSLLGLSLYVLGLAFGPVLAAPISESKGRKIVYQVSLPISALFTLGAGFSQNFASLAGTRFFAGFFGSPVLAVGAGSNVDVWPPIQRAVATSAFLLAPFLGPALG